MKKVQLTKIGYQELQREYQELTKKKRPLTIDKLQKARSMGDLSENSAYSAAREELALVEGRIQEISEILKNAEVLTQNITTSEVALGSHVVIEIDGVKKDFYVVGEFEADPQKKKLSHSSPIGKALLGKKVGDMVEINVPAGRIKYKILEIR